MIVTIKASTKKSLYGSFLESIQAENELRQKLIQSGTSTSYTYPKLKEPKSRLPRGTNHQFNITSYAGWFKDGATFYTVSEDLGVRIFITSQSLLEDNEEQLIPFIRKFESFPISAFDIHPESSIYNGYCASLTASVDSPIKLSSLIPDENDNYQILNTYNTQNNLTEKFPKITTLRFMNNSRFIAGSNGSILLYDVNHDDYLADVKTSIGTTSYVLPSNSEFLPNDSFFCASFNNQVKLYSSDLEEITAVKVDNGNGITQLIESNNGKYLYVIKRNSTAIDILDLRMNLLKVGELSNFSSRNQRINGDILPNSQGLLIGSSNGALNWYKDCELGLSSNPDSVILSDSSINSVSINPLESTVALTAIGDRSYDTPQIRINQILA